MAEQGQGHLVNEGSLDSLRCNVCDTGASAGLHGRKQVAFRVETICQECGLCSYAVSG